MARAAWASAERVLAVRLDTIGDVLMTGPALRALRDSGPPKRRIALLTSAPGAAAGELMPEVDDVLVYEAPWMKRHAGGGAEPDDLATIEALRRRRFDAAVIFTAYSQSPLPAALTCHLAGVPLRLAHCRESPYSLLTDHVPEPEPERGVRHEVERQLDLVAAVGATTDDDGLAVELPDADRERARDLLAELELDDARPWAVLHPGGSAPSRRYPPESWAAACRTLHEEHDVQIVVTGDAGEVALAEQVQRAAGLPGRSLAGRLELAELAALIEAAPLVLTGNTGPAHVAAAVGTPVVDLYALTNPQHTPWRVPSRVLSRDVPCRWCYSSVCPEGHHRCLRGVAPEEVVEAALSLLTACAPTSLP
jgi:lipopolysaccharide heptosyltransferase II